MKFALTIYDTDTIVPGGHGFVSYLTPHFNQHVLETIDAQRPPHGTEVAQEVSADGIPTFLPQSALDATTVEEIIERGAWPRTRGMPQISLFLALPEAQGKFYLYLIYPDMASNI